jgi:hypothetical protein
MTADTTGRLAQRQTGKVVLLAARALSLRVES